VYHPMSVTGIALDDLLQNRRDHYCNDYTGILKQLRMSII
jgi:hypothetical protein